MNDIASTRHRLVRWFALCLVAIWLTACTTAPISPQQVLTGQEGAVVVKLITNGAAAGAPAETLDALNLERIPEAGEKATGQNTATLVRTRDATYTTAVFSGMLPPGRYMLRRATGGNASMSYSFPIDARFGSFEVATNRITALGTLVIQPGSGQRFVVAYAPPDEEFQTTLKNLYPALVSQIQDGQPLGFAPTLELDRRAAMVRQAKRQAALWNGLAQTAAGEFMAGSKLGKVLWRPAGETRWRELDTGTLREVMSARPYRGGILAAGEEGLLRFSSDEGLTWETFTPPDYALIQVAQPMPDGGVVVFARRNKRWTVYVSHDLHAGQWRTLGGFDDAPSYNLPGARPMAVTMRGETGLMLPNGAFHVTDGKTLAQFSNGQSTLSVTSQPDGSLIARTALVTFTTLLSKDAGRTWTDLDTSRFVTAIAFKDSQTAYAVAPIAPGIFPGPYGLMTSRDGGRSWNQTGVAPGLTHPAAVDRLIVDQADGTLIAFLPENAILQSRDEGKTWKFVKDN